MLQLCRRGLESGTNGLDSSVRELAETGSKSQVPGRLRDGVMIRVMRDSPGPLSDNDLRNLSP